MVQLHKGGERETRDCSCCGCCGGSSTSGGGGNHCRPNPEDAMTHSSTYTYGEYISVGEVSVSLAVYLLPVLLLHPQVPLQGSLEQQQHHRRRPLLDHECREAYAQSDLQQMLHEKTKPCNN